MNNKKTALVGYTGFVGGNLNRQYKFTNLYNSKNIESICGKNYDMVVCAGIRAKKWLANNYPENDMKAIDDLKKNIDKIKTNLFVLISTIDVYKNPIDVDENTIIDTKDLHAYGINRYGFEKWVEERYKNSLIVRLPALFGKGLSKNFIYDMITRLPSVIIPSGIEELKVKLSNSLFGLIMRFYELDDYGNYKLKPRLNSKVREKLLDTFKSVDYTSLKFTDCRSRYQFYNLDYLWHHIEIALREKIEILNLAVEPVSAKQIAKECFNELFDHTIEGCNPAFYNMLSLYSEFFDGSNGYMFSTKEVLSQISEFVRTREVNN